MLNESFERLAQANNKEFRYRGQNPGRLENFSDACFALAITLLLISTSPPTSFEQVRRFVWELIPFTLCIVFIVLIWYEHFLFYYRYGLRHGKVIVLNSLFLVIVLFYVYPLKFLFRLLLIPMSIIFDSDALFTEMTGMIDAGDIGELMIIYGIGASAVFLVMMMLYRFALSQAKDLELTPVEIFDTKASIRTNLLMAIIPLLSVALAFIFLHNRMLAGLVPGCTYFLYTPVMWINGKKMAKARNKLLAELNAPPAIEETISVEEI